VNRHKIACAIIVGDDADEQNWRRCIESVEPWVDHIFVGYNGNEETFPHYQATKCKFTWQKFEWVDDFSISRNQSFDMIKASGEDFDWHFWIDSDDELINGDKIQSMLDTVKPETDGIFLVYEYGYDPQSDKVLVRQRRERFLRATTKWVWNYPLHEIAHPSLGAQFGDREDVSIRHHRKDGAEDKTRARNRRILVKALKDDPNNSRYKYYMANEIYYEAYVNRGDLKSQEHFHAAKKLYEEFIDLVGFNDDAYIAQHRIAEINRYLHLHNEAMDADLQNIKLQPSWPESWLGIAQSWLEIGNWDLAEFFANLTIEHILENLGKRNTQQVIEPQSEDYTPYVIRGIARENLGKLDEAIADYEIALSNAATDDVKQYIERAKNRKELGGESETLKETRKRLYGSKHDKSIAFVVPPTIEPWHPKYIDKLGSGGAEHCVVEIASRFAADGYRTAIFGMPGEFEGVDPDTGIEWWRVHDYGTGERFETVVSSRWPMVFDGEVNADCKILWMHDVNTGPNSENSPKGNRYEHPDAVIALTDWHKNYLSKMYKVDPRKFEVIGNGVDVDRFSAADLNRPLGADMVFASSPDRGILTLLNYWDDIKSIRSDATLDVYYGWTGIDKMIAAGMKGLEVFKMEVLNKLEEVGAEEAGIRWHNRVPRHELAEKLMSTSFWAYPTQFAETFCITALENQLAGVVPITSDLAALSEVVGAKNLLVYGWPNNEQYKKDWLSTYESLVSAPHEEIASIRQIGKDHASKFTWDAAYDKWRRVIAERTNK